MKKILLTFLISTLSLTFTACKKGNTDKKIDLPLNCFKGRMEIQDICGSYTIKVLEGNIDPSLIQASWQHPTTKVTYQNVFRIGNTCTFPTDIKEGETFYFTIRDNKEDAACVQCLAYAPAPDKVLSINVSATPCTATSN
jgi:hypothetical protein